MACRIGFPISKAGRLAYSLYDDRSAVSSLQMEITQQSSRIDDVNQRTGLNLYPFTLLCFILILGWISRFLPMPLIR